MLLKKSKNLILNKLINYGQTDLRLKLKALKQIDCKYIIIDCILNYSFKFHKNS